MGDTPAEDGAVEEACVLNPSPSASADGPTELTLGVNDYEWASFRDDDIIHQQSNILDEEAEKMPCVGEKVKFPDIWYFSHILWSISICIFFSYILFSDL